MCCLIWIRNYMLSANQGVVACKCDREKGAW